MIDFTVNKEGLQHNIEKARENNIIIPTIKQMQHPELIPEQIKEKLKTHGSVGRRPRQPLPYHLEERAQGERRSVP